MKLKTMSGSLHKILVALATVLYTFVGNAIPAHAQLEGADDFPVERFRLAMDRDGVLDTEWGAVPRHKSWDMALWLGAADDPLIVYDQMDGERLGSLVARRVAGNLSGAIALWDRFQFGVDIPIILSQSADQNVFGMPGDSLGSFGFGDARILPKVQLLNSDDHGVHLALIPAFTLPTGGGSDYRGESGLSFAPEMAVSRAMGAVRLSSNIGYRARRNATLVNLDVSDEIFARFAAGYRFASGGGPPLELDLILSTATAAAEPFASANQNHLELLAGAVYDFPGPVLGILAGGLGVNEGFGTPDWRVVAGVRLSKHRAPDADGDGIWDSADACPVEPEDIDTFEDKDGCPDPDNDKDQVLDVADKAPMEPEDHDGFEDDDGVPDPDNDNDGILDTADACPLKAETKNGFQDDDGCPDEIPDRDGDGLKDNVDQCPEQAEDQDGFEDGNGCPDPDNDKDTVLDEVDRCMNEPGPVENRGCPDQDRDGDTVVDRLDNCPDEPGSPDNKGCKSKQLVQLQGTQLELLGKVYFRTDRDALRRRSFKLLRNVAQVIKSHPEIGKIRVEGHTDAVGDDAYNMDLSQRRAEAVVRFLVKEGVPEDRLIAKGFGKSQPIDSNKSRSGRAKNRRVEFKILDATDAVIDSSGKPD